jgi:hypothetical protein
MRREDCLPVKSQISPWGPEPATTEAFTGSGRSLLPSEGAEERSNGAGGRVDLSVVVVPREMFRFDASCENVRGNA